MNVRVRLRAHVFVRECECLCVRVNFWLRVFVRVLALSAPMVDVVKGFRCGDRVPFWRQKRYYHNIGVHSCFLSYMRAPIESTSERILNLQYESAPTQSPARPLAEAMG